MILPWHIVRLWVLISLAALLAGVLLAPAPTLADELHHAGLIVRSPDAARVQTLLDQYSQRFTHDFLAFQPPWDTAPA